MRVEISHFEVVYRVLIVLRCKAFWCLDEVEVVRLIANLQVLSPCKVEPSCLLRLGMDIAQVVSTYDDLVIVAVVIDHHLSFGLSEKELHVLSLDLLIVELILGRN